MKKLTAGIFTVLMGLVSVNAADAAVASKGYVDKVVGENTTKITTLTETVEENKDAADATAQALTEHKSAYATKVTELENADKALSDRITANAGAIDTLLGTGTGGDGSGTFGQLSEDVSNLKSTVGDANSGLVKQVGSLETLVGDTAVATQISNALTDLVGETPVQSQISNALTDLVGTETVATQINTAVTSLKNNEIQANTNAINALTGENGAITKNTAAITTLNGDGEGSVNKKIETAIGNLDLQAISKVPAACKDANHYCVLTTNGEKFVWEIIVRDDTNLEETETGLYGEKTITQ